MMPMNPSETPERPEALRLENVHLVFQSRLRRPVYALRGLDLMVEQGSVVGLLGPNGCGKTTAISCILGLLTPQRGSVKLLGHRVGRDPFPAGRVHYGAMLEDTRLPPFLGVRDALGMLCRQRGMSRDNAGWEMERVIELCLIRKLLDRRVGVLSKGQARRVGLAAALIGDPPLLILDEPSAGLDVSARVEFEAIIRQLRDGRRTMLIASHLLTDVQASCSHVGMMKAGRVVVYGETQRLLSDHAQESRRSDIYLPHNCAAALQGLGIAHQPARYPGELVLDSLLTDRELLEKLLTAGLTPKRMEPRTNLVSFYLEQLRENSA